MNGKLKNFMVSRGCAQYVIDRGLLGYLVPCWESTVAEIERGYHDIWEEYTNDVDSRQIIEECRPYWAQENQEEIERRVSQADHRFILATVPIEESIWGSKKDITEEKHFWYFRAPKDVIGEYQLKPKVDQGSGGNG